MKVDQLFVNGDIHTFDPGQPRASTVAVIAGRIVAVGDDDRRAILPMPELISVAASSPASMTPTTIWCSSA